MDNQLGRPLEVEVRDSLEKAMKILKQKMSKEGILQELKRRRFYEKPSVKKKRKMREARKRLLDQIASEDALFTGGHFLQPAFSRLTRHGQGYQLVQA